MMNEFFERISKLSPKRLALLALDLQAKIEAGQRSEREPIAIIGMACRFPGADSPEAFWHLLRDGIDAIGEIPISRWDAAAYYDPDPDAAGKIATRWGGFVEPIDHFDPQFFGISPREAQSMDPQQRLLLEVSWEALERAGQVSAQLSGSATGTFVGICNNDYATMLLSGAAEHIDAYLSTGNAHSVASGRLAYVLGLHGPSLSVDTACSSSLVATHLAIQSLRNRECRMALAGGVNAILAPTTSITLSRAKMMAADGRCKAFDIRADGFVRAEGCGMLVLKRLSDARTDGDPILAVIRGSALSQDGRSNGLTAPNGPAQVSVIQAALSDAGLAPADVHYVETHGTGTALGDPIEVQALGAALGTGRDPTTRLQIGSVKTNIGHLESAAGVAGLIKAVLMLQHEFIPPHLHLTQLNPHIDWDSLPIDVPTAGIRWPDRSGPRIAGVSSFGFSGTNAHVLLEAAPAPPPAEPSTRPQQVLALTAHSTTALQALARRFAVHLAERSSLASADIAYTANTGRAAFSHRLAIVGENLEQLRAGLAAYAAGEEHDDLHVGRSEGLRPPATAFVFTGHGAQYSGMGQQLYATEPVFRAAFDRCDQLLRADLGCSLHTIISAASNGQAHQLDNMAYAQPALFALQYALAELWQSWGIRPAAVAGHSVGEYAAAVVAGMLSLEDGLRLVAARGQLMASLPPGGEMAAVMSDEASVARILAPYNNKVTIAAINGPQSVVISGELIAIEAVLSSFAAAGIETRRLAIPVAAHSPQVDSILDRFTDVAAQISYHTPQIDMISGLSGRLASTSELSNADYWRRHLRHPVRFADAAANLYALGYRAFVEIGPHPSLIGMMRHFLPADSTIWAPSLRRQHDENRQMLRSLATLAVNGIAIDWNSFYHNETRQRVQLPTYPFERQRYWVDLAARTPARARPAAAHPLLGSRLRSPAVHDTVFETRLGLEALPFLNDHRVFGALVLPSPIFIELALAAAREAHGSPAGAVEQFTIREALVLPEQGARVVQIVIVAAREGAPAFEIFSRPEESESWTLHASGRLTTGQRMPDTQLNLAQLQAACSERIAGADYYSQLAQLGLAFGPSFRGLREIWRREGEALGLIELPAEFTPQASSYTIHPALLDACLHLLGAPLAVTASTSAQLLIAIDRFQIYAQPGLRLWNHTRIRERHSGGIFTSDMRLYDEHGQLVAEATGVHIKAANPEVLLRATDRSLNDWLYEVRWQPRPLPIGNRPLLADPHALISGVAPHADILAMQHQLADALDLVPELETLSLAYTRRALAQLGWAPRIGETITADALAAQLGVLPRHQRLFERMLAMLGDAGLLRATNHGWQVIQLTADPADLKRSVAALRERFLAGAPEITLLEHCGEHLAQALRGVVEPMQLLFPDGALTLTEPLYGATPSAQVANGLVSKLVSAALVDWPAEQTLRVLEIGAGSGATTRAVLPMLPASHVEYWFTDVSPRFTANAHTELRSYPYVRTHLFDVERNPAEQGLPAQGFHMVLAANVLHATADLSHTLANVRSLLAPGGLLVLLEATRPLRWVDMTFGLTEGWWRYSDRALRPDHPLLVAPRWVELLGSNGFVDAAALPHDAIGQALIVARAPAAQDHARTDQWLIFADAGGVGMCLAARLAQAGECCTLIFRGDRLAQLGADRWQVAADAAAMGQLLAALGRPAGRRRVLFLWGLDAPNDAALSADDMLSAQEQLCGGALGLAQALLGGPAQLWVVTRGAQPASPIQGPAAVGQAALWGLGRVIALEHSELWGGLVDLAPGADRESDGRALLSEVLHPDGEDQVALRSDTRLVPRLERTVLLANAQPAFRADGTYLITGGLGGLGLKLARWLAEGGARHIVLTGRQGMPDRASWPSLASNSRAAGQVAAIQAIEALGTTVLAEVLDVADQEGMQELFTGFGSTLPPLRGIFHTAAELGNAPIRELTPLALHGMLRPKVAGGWLLHQLSQSHQLDYFVLFSSTTALWGSRGLAHYAAANQTLDALAHYRRCCGLPALSINWGTWDEMRAASADEQRQAADYGLGRMPAGQALHALGSLLHAKVAQMAIAAVNWDILKPAYEARGSRPLLAQMASAPAAQPKDRIEAAPVPVLLRRVERVIGDERRLAIADFVRETVARTLGVASARQIDDRQGLFEMGLDSLMAIELKSRLEQAIGQPLPSTLTFNYPSVGELTGFFADQLLSAAPAALAAEVSGTRPAQPLVDSADTDELSEDDLAELLAARLAQLQ